VNAIELGSDLQGFFSDLEELQDKVTDDGNAGGGVDPEEAEAEALGDAAVLDGLSETAKNELLKFIQTMEEPKSPGDLLELALVIGRIVLEGAQERNESKAREAVSEKAAETLKAKVKAYVAGKKLLGGKATEFGKSFAASFDRLSGMLKVVAGAGKVYERLGGISGDTAPFETAYIYVGEPFRLDGVQVEPDVAAAGDVIRIRVPRRSFSLQVGADRVWFDESLGKVRAVRSVEGGFELEVEVPPLPAGEHRIEVIASGRRSAKLRFRIENRPRIIRVRGAIGYPANAQYSGSWVDVIGDHFDERDAVLFAGLPSHYVVANGFEEGHVRLAALVPAGAVAGPITVRRRDGVTSKELGFLFTPLGPPRIEQVEPTSATAGSVVTLKVANLPPLTGPDVFEGEIRFGANRVLTLLQDGQLMHVVVPRVPLTPPELSRVVTLSLRTPAGEATTEFTVRAGGGAGGIISAGCRGLIDLARALDFAAGRAEPNDDPDWIRNGDQTINLDPPYEEGDCVTDLGAAAFPRFPVGAEFNDVIFFGDEFVGDVELGGVGDQLVAPNYAPELRGTVRGTVLIKGDNNRVQLAVRDSPGPGVIIRGNGNEVDVVCERAGGDGLRIEGGRGNRVTVGAVGNAGAGVVLSDGAAGNQLEVRAIGNAGCGVVLAGGAAGNLLFVQATSNRLHGVWAHGITHHNKIDVWTTASGGKEGSVSQANGGDGLRVEGAGVQMNTFLMSWDANEGNGVALLDGAQGNFLSGKARTNRLNGVYAGRGPAGSPHGNHVLVEAIANGAYGYLLSGIEEPGAGNPHPFGGWNLQAENNAQGGVRLEQGTRGLRLRPRASGGTVGIELDGADVTDNELFYASAWGVAGDGIVLRGARRNRITGGAYWAGGDGVVLRGAVANEIRVEARRCAGAGLRVTDGSEQNRIEGWTDPETGGRYGVFGGNRHGVVVAGGARNNTLRELDVFESGSHAVWIRGAGTDGHPLLECRLGLPVTGWDWGGNAGDGLRIEGGATGVSLVRSRIASSGGAGVRVAGAGTRGVHLINSTVDVWCDPYGVVIPQPVGVVIENEAEEVAIGDSRPGTGNLIAGNGIGLVATNGVRRVQVVGNCFLTNLTTGVELAGVSGIQVGPHDPEQANEVRGGEKGIVLRAATQCRIANNRLLENGTGLVLLEQSLQNRIGPGNEFAHNQTGLTCDASGENWIEGNLLTNNATVGIRLTAAPNNQVRANRIIANGVGVIVVGGAALGNTLTANSITANVGPGIRLTEGGNRGLAAPQVTGVEGGHVRGTASAPNGSTVELFLDGEDEGETWIGSARVWEEQFETEVSASPTALALARVNATVTDPEGNTSEFSQSGAPGGAGGGESPIVVFTSTRDGNPELYLLDPLGSSPTRLTFDAGADTSPAVSPRGTQLAFVSTRHGNREIYGMALAPRAPASRRTENAAEDYDPAWSADGERLVFISERDGNAEVYGMKADGSDPRRLTENPATDRWPAFSPDGSRIVFASDREGAFRLYTMNVDGSDVRAVPGAPPPARQPAWSPDGDWIAFVTDQDGNPEVYRIRPDGSELQRLTRDAAIDESPSWPAAGGAVLFASNRQAGFELYVLRLGDPAPVRLTVSEGENREPAGWR
jgi:TolB protein